MAHVQLMVNVQFIPLSFKKDDLLDMNILNKPQISQNVKSA